LQIRYLAKLYPRVTAVPLQLGSCLYSSLGVSFEPLGLQVLYHESLQL